jgi:uncharacterized membrane protein
MDITSDNRKHILFLVAVLALGVWARTWTLTQESLAIDELCSVPFLNAGSFSSFLSTMESDNGTPPSPVYFFLEYETARIFKDSTMALRLLSLALGCLALPAIYILAARMFDGRTGIIALFLAATSFPLIYYSQHIRMYAPLPLLTALSLLTLIRFVDGRRGFWNYVVNALLVWTHMFAWLLLIAETAYVVIVQRKKTKALLHWFFAHGAIAIFFAAWMFTADMPTVLNSARRDGSSFQTDQPVVLGLVLAGGRFSNDGPADQLPLGVSLDWPLTAVIFLLAAFISLRAALDKRGCETEETRHVLLLFLSVLIPIALLMAYSVCSGAGLQYRYLIGCAPPLQILAAASITRIPWRWAGRLALTLVACLSLYQFSALARGPLRANWRSAGDFIAANRGPNDTVLVGEKTNDALLAYNSPIPREEVIVRETWLSLCDPVAEACRNGDNAWVALLMRSSEDRLESCFIASGLRFEYRDFGGWPRVRVYKIQK